MCYVSIPINQVDFHVLCVCEHEADTLSLDMGHIQTFLQAQDDSTKLKVKGIAEEENINKRLTSAEDRAKQIHVIYKGRQIKSAEVWVTCIQQI